MRKEIGTAKRPIELKKSETRSRREWTSDDENESLFGFLASWSGGIRKETHKNEYKRRPRSARTMR
jgi:hypothetical protein